MRSASASAEVRAPADAVFGFLADLGNHWRLASRWIEVVVLTPAGDGAQGATVRLNGPLGLRRTVHTRVDATEPDRLVRGHALAGRTRAEVEWELQPRGAMTRVTVVVALAHATAIDRLLWTAGGRLWLTRHLRRTAAGLGTLVDADGVIEPAMT